MTIDQWLAKSTQQLAAVGIISARLDTLVLLSDELKRNKTWLLAHGEEEIEPKILVVLDGKLSKRATRYPLAYIREGQEFYGRDFKVTEDVLIPRPETEELIEQLKKLSPKPGERIIDVGTGSGAIATTVALELASAAGGATFFSKRVPEGLSEQLGKKVVTGPASLQYQNENVVEAVDISPAALTIARDNAKTLGAYVDFYESDLLSHVKNKYNYILANLPYVAEDWQRSPETDHEPKLALFAQNEGLDLVIKLLAQAAQSLQPGGYVLLEADPRQHTAIIQEASKHNIHKLAQKDFILVLQLQI